MRAEKSSASFAVCTLVLHVPSALDNRESLLHVSWASRLVTTWALWARSCLRSDSGWCLVSMDTPNASHEPDVPR